MFKQTKKLNTTDIGRDLSKSPMLFMDFKWSMDTSKRIHSKEKQIYKRNSLVRFSSVQRRAMEVIKKIFLVVLLLVVQLDKLSVIIYVEISFDHRINACVIHNHVSSRNSLIQHEIISAASVVVVVVVVVVNGMLVHGHLYETLFTYYIIIFFLSFFHFLV